MNKIPALGLIVAFLMAMNGCKNEPSAAKPAEHTTSIRLKDQNTLVHVPLATAQANIARYDSMCTIIFSKMGGNAPIKAYTVHAADLFESLGIPGSYADSSLCRYHHARVYLGLDSSYSFKLYFTPVTGADLSADEPVAGTDIILKDTKGDSYVMDLNAPCPNTCDDQSPLFNTLKGKK